tara:strand:+ start:73391 stop:73897 length:507 start_codon:yes stop_codon:yes gene_type:complete
MPLNFDPTKLQKTDIFIETGTYKGNTLAKIKDKYKEIHTIEIVAQFHNDTKKQYESDKNINFHLNDSPVGLKKILKDIDKPVTFWLDAHYQGGAQTNSTKKPLLDELNVIKAHDIKTHMVLIDDVRLFGVYGTTVDAVKSKLLEINKDYTFEFGEGVQANDVLIARVK